MEAQQHKRYGSNYSIRRWSFLFISFCFPKQIGQVMSKKKEKISEVHIQKSIFSKQKKSLSSGFEEISK
jgi:hypothetical protein